MNYLIINAILLLLALLLAICMKRLQATTVILEHKDVQTALANQPSGLNRSDRNLNSFLRDYNQGVLGINTTEDKENNNFRNNTLTGLRDESQQRVKWNSSHVPVSNNVKQLSPGDNYNSNARQSEEEKNSFEGNNTNPIDEESNLNYSIVGKNESSHHQFNSSYASAFANISNTTLQDDDNSFDWRTREETYTITRPEDFPYSVLLIMYSRGMEAGVCSGSVLTPEWILTASHCVYNIDKVVVYAGGNSLQEYETFISGKKNLPATAQVLISKSLIVHPNYPYLTQDCDVGLVKVNGKFNMTKSVNTIKLATTPWKETYHSYTTCELTGFGVVQIGVKKHDDTHRKTHHLDVKNPCLCAFRLQSMFGVKVTSRYICTRPKLDYGVCPGDSGGGLVCGGKVRAVAMQLIKLKETEYCDISLLAPMQCGGVNTLSIFQDTCPFLHWINSYVKLFNKSEISSQCKYTGSGALLFVNSSISVVSLAIALVCILNCTECIIKI